ncbi:hypothetical protein [Mycobacterium sp.]|uniref:hypothetical protein n=1 Tax=Mycobacterium sp. TaxID=1785 RepID=UPI0025FEF677|nr:hypothetical protein [Mycobacterium sp.]
MAAQDNDPELARHFFRALRSVEVFFGLTSEYRAGKEFKATPLLRLPDGTHAMMLYTSKSHSDLPDRFGGSTFENALAAALKMPQLDWVIISNRDAQWVAIHKSRIPVVLGDLKSESNGENGSSTSATHGKTPAALNGLITRAVDATAAEDIRTAVDSALAGREVFLELAPGQADDGQPLMNVFQAGDFTKLIRVYTSRARPGIKYGGMTWEALKEMLHKVPVIDGVQVMNDAEDWLVFDRESLNLPPREEKR